MDFLVLGPLEIRCDARRDTVPGRLRRVLLGVLLARANQAVPADVLPDARWGVLPVERRRQRLHLHVHRLRGAIGDPDRLSFGPDGYRLRVLPGELDAERFDTLVAEGLDLPDRDPRRAADALRQAVALWRGMPFADLDIPILTGWAHELAERRLVACEALHEAELACGRNAAVAGELAGLVREHPLRERLHGLLMVALYRSGRQGEALAAYRAARETLVAELGLEPGPELRELEARMLAGEPVEVGGVGDVGDVGERRLAVPAQLPADVTGFVGRDAELAELDGLLSRGGTGTPGVVISAVAGTPGVGKTALALRWAHRVRGRFPDGQLYVDLRGYGPDQPVAPEDALAGFLRELGLDGAAIPQDLAERAARFRTLLDGRRMLVVLDNARGVAQVRPLLPGGGTCFALVTSRDALAGLVAREGAHRLSLDRLPLTDARALLREALSDRAAADAAAADALVERCARLPLALRVSAELARSQPARPLADLVGELADRQGALDRLDVDGDPYTAVRAVFSWSYQRLDEGAARVFRLLGVHPGHDVDTHALAAMADDGLRPTRRALDALLRAHLVDQTTGGRYQPHDLLRAYAAELAADLDSANQREAAMTRLRGYYLSTAAAAMDAIAPYESSRRPKVPAWHGEAPSLMSPDHALRWLDAERANLVEATRHGDHTFVALMSETVWRYLDNGGYHDEALILHTRALRAAVAAGESLAEANARRHLAVAMDRMGRDAEEAVDHLRRALAVYERAGDQALRGATLINLGNAYASRGDEFQALRHYELALRLNPDDWSLRRAALVNSGKSLRLLRRHAEAVPRLDEAFALCREHGDRANEANILVGLAESFTAMGRAEEAFDHARRGLALARETGYRQIEAHCLRALGVLYTNQGDSEQALRLHNEAVTLARSVGDSGLLVEALNAFAATRAAFGHPAEALRTYDEAMAVATEGDHREMQGHAHAGVAAVHAALGDHDAARDHWRRALGHYEALGLPQAAETRARLGGG